MGTDVIEARRNKANAEQRLEEQIDRARTRMILAELERRDRLSATPAPIDFWASQADLTD
jgi:hypothetical protein